MNKTILISFINALVLLTGIFVMHQFSILNETNLMILVIGITLLQLVLWGYFLTQNKASLARQFLLSGLLILVIGTSSCVTIIPRKKKKPQRPPLEKPVTDSTKTT